MSSNRRKPGTSNAHGMESTLRKRKRIDLSACFKLPTVSKECPSAPNPPGLAIPLFPYQSRSLYRMMEVEGNGVVNPEELGMSLAQPQTCKGGVVADTVGMGKTAQLIALMLSRPRRDGANGVKWNFLGGPDPRNSGSKLLANNLVVTPGHLCRQWESEIRRFAPQLRVLVITSLNEFMAVSIHELCRVDCVITSLNFLQKEYVSMFLADSSLDEFCTKCRKQSCLKSWHRSSWSHASVCQKQSDHFAAGKGKRAARAHELEREGGGDHWPTAGALSDAANGAQGQILHRVRWHRVILDECHEIVDTCHHNEGHMDTIKALNTEHVWCVTGTPFPNGDRSMYGIHCLLGLKLKLHVSNDLFARNKPLPPLHPFEVLKRRFYLQNTPESVGDEWEVITGGGLKKIENTVKLQFAYVERGFYEECARRVARTDPYHERCETLRKLCCHPAASSQWETWRATGGGCTGLDGLRQKMLVHKKKALELKDLEIARLRHSIEASENSLALLRATANMGALTAAMLERLPWAHEAGLQDPESQEKQDRKRKHGGWRIPHEYVNKAGVCSVSRRTTHSRREVQVFLLESEMGQSAKCRMDEVDALQAYVQTSRAKTLPLKQQELAAIHTDLEYFSAIVEELKAVDADPEQDCSICGEDNLRMVTVTPCGHWFCTPCLHRWLVSRQTCPQCRRKVGLGECCDVNLRLPAIAPGSALVQQYGTKPSAVVEFIKHTRTAATKSELPTPKFIVFSQWHAVLCLLSSTMSELGVESVRCEGSGKEQEAAIAKFRGEEADVLMISMEHAASGTNLQMANHVILVEPAGHNNSHGAAVETQAIGRSVRLGQTQLVTVTRFVIEDSIEEDIHNQNSQARNALSTQGSYNPDAGTSSSGSRSAAAPDGISDSKCQNVVCNSPCVLEATPTSASFVNADVVGEGCELQRHSQANESSVAYCPLGCGTRFVLADLSNTAINQHVDRCLNRGILKVDTDADCSW